MSMEAPADSPDAVDLQLSAHEVVAETFRVCAPLSLRSIVGAPVRSVDGRRIGFIETVMTDLPSGRIAYAVLRLGSRWQLRKRLRPVPWQSLSFLRNRNGIAARLDLESCGDEPRGREISAVWPNGGGANGPGERAPPVKPGSDPRRLAAEMGETR